MTDRPTVRRLVVAAAVVTVLLGFTLGFGLAQRNQGASPTVAADGPTTSASSSAPTSAPAVGGTTTPDPPRTEPPASALTTDPPTTSSTAPAPTEPPTTPAPPPPTTAAPVATPPAPTTVRTVIVTVPPTSRVTSTLAPPRVEVLYAADAANRVVIPRVGTATLTIRNTGGSASQWLVTGTGFSVKSASQGTLQGGQSTTVLVGAPPGDLPRNELTGTISVLGAVNPSIGFVIPRA